MEVLFQEIPQFALTLNFPSSRTDEGANSIGINTYDQQLEERHLTQI